MKASIENLIKQAALIEQQDQCKLYVIRAGANLFKWLMISPTTGAHMITEPGEKSVYVMTGRVKAHWKGFLINQSKK